MNDGSQRKTEHKHEMFINKLYAQRNLARKEHDLLIRLVDEHDHAYGGQISAGLWAEVRAALQ